MPVEGYGTAIILLDKFPDTIKNYPLTIFHEKHHP